MYLILLALLLPLLIYYYFIKPLKYWQNMGVVCEKPTIFIGNMWEIMLQRIDVFKYQDDLYNKFPNHRYVGVYQFNKPILFLRDMDLIKRITIRDAEYFTDHQAFSDESIDPLWSRNLFASKGDAWHQMRTALSPSFTSSKMKMMFGLMNNCADQFINYFVENGKDHGNEMQELDIKKAFTRYTNDVIATCAFGVTCDSLREPNNEFYVKGLDATDFSGWRGLKFFLYPLCPSLLKLFKIKIIEDEIGNFFRDIIKKTIQLREEQGIKRPDMIQLMMELRNKVGKDVLTDEDLTSQALIFFLAGFESSSVLMAFVAYELAINQEMQERLRREITDSLKETNGELTYESLIEMKYLDMFINETLRKWPPTPLTDRMCSKDYYLEPERPGESGVHLKKGDIVWMPIHAVHMDPNLFEDPEKFDPERFNDENKSSSNNSFLSFGIGPRICIGSRFALLETKAVIVKLIQEFELVPVAKTNIPMVLDRAQVSTYSEGGWWVGLEKIIK